jgi:hypothetical protein
MSAKTKIVAGSIVYPLLYLMLFASTTWAQTSDKSTLTIDQQRFHRRAELDTPQPDRSSADGDTALCEQILDVTVAKIESVIQPDCVTDVIGRESVAFICIHPPVLASSSY